MVYNSGIVASKEDFRNLPSVDKLLVEKRIARLVGEYSHDTVTNVVRRYLEELRESMSQSNPCPTFDQIAITAESRIQSLGTVGPKAVINATGVILHTNLGRSPLSPEAIIAMKSASEGFNNLEIDLESGKRGSRHVHVERLLCQLTAAEDALVVNNNAAAVLLGLSALAKRKEVIVSRGQAVEIGGGFRIPDVMRQSGAKLVEVGTTNRTYPADYEQAITPRTAALLRVHSSNFKVVGFAQEVTIEEMADLGKRRGIPVFDDLGSGCLLDTTVFGLDAEPRVQDSVAAGAGLTFFSGDKLLGGPQAGIIVGEKHLITKLKKHPLARAMRIDKIRLAALSATLIHYLKGEALCKIPIWRMISSPLNEIERRANQWAQEIGELASTIAGESTVGGGSLPGSTLPTRLTTIQIPSNTKVMDLAQKLRLASMPLIGRIEHKTLVLDPRSVLPEQDADMLQAVRKVLLTMP
ncbi:MAG: L-seryl-tRNA(Sec) selenium transferase [Dehalococcoidia bacterium]|nr:L-seryl-tRNA(Sec) selenium transferase [Dehalococcoidia bacterium]